MLDMFAISPLSIFGCIENILEGASLPVADRLYVYEIEPKTQSEDTV
jgi:hypothetical protein